MAMKNPGYLTLSTLPPPPPKPSKSQSVSDSYLPKPIQKHKQHKILSPSNHKKQTQINIHSNIKTDTITTNPPSPTFSSSIRDYDINDSDEKKESTYSTDICTLYGLSNEPKTNTLSWSNIINKYCYTKEEIIGARKLQFELSKLFHITHNTNECLPPFECLRYYCGCSNEIERAVTKWNYSIKMYKEYGMEQISDTELIQCFRVLSKSIAFGGYDSDGCRIISIKYSLFYFSEYESINVFLLAGFYLFYYLTHDIKAHRNGVCLLCDLNGFSLSNFSFTVEKNGLHFAQKVLPIRIKKVFVLDAPWIAHYALKLVLPLLTEKLRKRVFIVTNEELYHSDVHQKIVRKRDLPVLVGGTFDEMYRSENNNQSFLYNVLLNYLTKTIDLKHFNIDFNTE